MRYLAESKSMKSIKYIKNKFEDWLFPILSNAMTSPNCAYVVTLIISYAVYKSPPANLLELSQTLIQSYFQGVGLCILGYASNLASQKLMTIIMQMWQWLKELKESEQVERRQIHENQIELMNEFKSLRALIVEKKII